jgi:hypothetical protein
MTPGAPVKTDHYYLGVYAVPSMQREYLLRAAWFVDCDQSRIRKIHRERHVDCDRVYMRLLNPCEQKK